MDTLEESFCCKATKYLGPGGDKKRNNSYIFCPLTENCILDKPLMAGILRKDVLEINLRYGAYLSNKTIAIDFHLEHSGVALLTQMTQSLLTEITAIVHIGPSSSG